MDPLLADGWLRWDAVIGGGIIGLIISLILRSRDRLLKRFRAAAHDAYFFAEYRTAVEVTKRLVKERDMVDFHLNRLSPADADLEHRFRGALEDKHPEFTVSHTINSEPDGSPSIAVHLSCNYGEKDFVIAGDDLKSRHTIRLRLLDAFSNLLAAKHLECLRRIDPHLKAWGDD